MSYDWHTVRAKQQLFGNNFNIPKYDSKIHIIHYFYDRFRAIAGERLRNSRLAQMLL